MATYRNILILKSGALGDLIAGTTAIRVLRNAFPDAKITAFSNILMREVAPPGSLIDDLIISDAANTSPGKFIALLREIRKRRFDLTVNLRWSSEGSALLCYLSGSKSRVGSGPASVRWIYTMKAPIAVGRRHEFLRHLDIVEALGLDASEPEPYVHISENDRRFADEACVSMGMKSGRFLAVHPGASARSKAWAPEKFIELGRQFVKTFESSVLITWGPGEEALARQVASGIGPNARMSPKTSISGLAALLRMSALCVCNYSGVMNVGMAVKTPLVALGCTSAEDWGPYGEIHRTVNSAQERDSYTEEERFAAMNSILTENVWSIVSARWRELASELIGAST